MTGLRPRHSHSHVTENAVTTKNIQLLVDGNAVGYTGHHLDQLLAADGTQVQAVVNFLLTIRDLKWHLPEANIIVLWDGVSWRKDVLASYKEDRDPDLSEYDPTKPMDAATAKRYEAACKKAASRAAYKAQVPLIQQALEHLAIPQATCANYEADDLAALFADRYNEQGYPVRLVTTDGDWKQLVRPRVVWKSNRAPFTLINVQNFTAQTGFRSVQAFLEAKILGGDKGDCVPGIPGLGEKTLERFFQAWSCIDEFFADAVYEDTFARVAGKACPKALREFRERGPLDPQLALNRVLVDLRTPERPKPSHITIKRGEFNRAALLELTKALDLYRLSSDLGGFLKPFTE